MQTSSDKNISEQKLSELKFGEVFIKPIVLPSSFIQPKTLTLGDDFEHESKKEDSETDD